MLVCLPVGSYISKVVPGVQAWSVSLFLCKESFTFSIAILVLYIKDKVIGKGVCCDCRLTKMVKRYVFMFLDF